MDPSRPRPLRRLCQIVSAALALALLGACGGGGSSAGSGSGGSGGGLPESTYLLAEFVATDTTAQYVRVWDPARPAVAVQQVRILNASGIAWSSSHLGFSDATTFDPATGTVTTRGHAKVFFDNDGRLYSIDLRGGQPHAPVQLSSATDVDGVAAVFPMDAAGDDAWVDATVVGHDVAIRATMAATDAPIDIWSIRGALRDASGFPAYFVVASGLNDGTHVQPLTFGLRAADFTVVPQADIEAMDPYDDWLGPDPALPGVGYARMNGTLRVVRWGTAGVTVDAGNLLAVGDPVFGAPRLAAADGVYLTSNQAVIALSGGQARALGSVSAVPAGLVDAGNAVAVVEARSGATGCCRVIEAVPKAGGPAVTLASGDDTLELVGAAGARVVIGQAGAGGGAPSQTAVLVGSDGTGAVSLPGTWAALVRADTHLADVAPAPLRLLTCTSLAAAPGFCGPGALTELDLASGALSAAGSLAAAQAWLRAPSADPVAGVPGSLAGQTFTGPADGFSAQATSGRDAWQFTPGTAGSLARVTANLP